MGEMSLCVYLAARYSRRADCLSNLKGAYGLRIVSHA